MGTYAPPALRMPNSPMIISGRDRLELTIHTPGRKAQLTIDGQVDIGQIVQDEIDNALDSCLAEMLGNGLHFVEFAVLVGHQSVLRKVPWKSIDNTSPELFFLFRQITTCNEQDERGSR